MNGMFEEVCIPVEQAVSRGDSSVFPGAVNSAGEHLGGVACRWRSVFGRVIEEVVPVECGKGVLLPDLFIVGEGVVEVAPARQNLLRSRSLPWRPSTRPSPSDSAESPIRVVGTIDQL